MSVSARKFIIGIVLFLSAGGLIGWLYGQALTGLLIAALLALAWQVRQVLSFDRAMRTDNFDRFRVGDGLWEQISSRYGFERERGTRRKADYRKLLEEVQKSTKAMPDGAVILDANNEIVTCNRAAKKLVGLKRKKDKGQRIDNIVRAPKLARLVSNDDFDNVVEIPSPVIDGNWLHCRMVPYGAEQKLLLLRDVTDRIELGKMRRDFVANASHELRSPLTVVSGYLDALAEDDDIPDHWDRPISQMQNQAMRMNQILNEMLELSRLESSGVATMDTPVDVGDLLHQVVSDFERPAGGAEIEVDVESNARLLGNQSEIESVVINLLSNAVRHTPEGGKVSLIWRAGPEGGELIARDTGDGIDASHIPRLTERFFRVDRGRSRGEGGVGLGLAIVKHVLVRHDAQLDISSEFGSGSEFRCLFPAKRIRNDVVAELS